MARFSAAAPYSIGVLPAARVVPVARPEEATASGPRVVLREPREHAVPCTRPVRLLVAVLPAPVPASAHAPEWVRVPALASAPDLVVRLDCCLLVEAKLRARNGPARMPGVDASSIRRPRKAR